MLVMSVLVLAPPTITLTALLPATNCAVFVMPFAPDANVTESAPEPKLTLLATVFVPDSTSVTAALSVLPTTDTPPVALSVRLVEIVTACCRLIVAAPVVLAPVMLNVPVLELFIVSVVPVVSVKVPIDRMPVLLLVSVWVPEPLSARVVTVTAPVPFAVSEAAAPLGDKLFAVSSAPPLFVSVIDVIADELVPANVIAALAVSVTVSDVAAMLPMAFTVSAAAPESVIVSALASESVRETVVAPVVDPAIVSDDRELSVRVKLFATEVVLLFVMAKVAAASVQAPIVNAALPEMFNAEIPVVAPDVSKFEMVLV